MGKTFAGAPPLPVSGRAAQVKTQVGTPSAGRPTQHNACVNVLLLHYAEELPIRKNLPMCHNSVHNINRTRQNSAYPRDKHMRKGAYSRRVLQTKAAVFSS